MVVERIGRHPAAAPTSTAAAPERGADADGAAVGLGDRSANAGRRAGRAAADEPPERAGELRTAAIESATARCPALRRPVTADRTPSRSALRQRSERDDCVCVVASVEVT